MTERNAANTIEKVPHLLRPYQNRTRYKCEWSERLSQPSVRPSPQTAQGRLGVPCKAGRWGWGMVGVGVLGRKEVQGGKEVQVPVPAAAARSHAAREVRSVCLSAHPQSCCLPCHVTPVPASVGCPTKHTCWRSLGEGVARPLPAQAGMGEQQTLFGKFHQLPSSQLNGKMSCPSRGRGKGEYMSVQRVGEGWGWGR